MKQNCALADGERGAMRSFLPPDSRGIGPGAIEGNRLREATLASSLRQKPPNIQLVSVFNE
jgi:hypothetical protein